MLLGVGPFVPSALMILFGVLLLFMAHRSDRRKPRPRQNEQHEIGDRDGEHHAPPSS